MCNRISNIVLVLLCIIIFDNTQAQSKKISKLILLDERSYLMLERIIKKNKVKTIKRIYNHIGKYLDDTTKQTSKVYIEYDHPVEPNTYKFEYKITKRIAVIYVICVLYYKDIRLGNKLCLYDFRTKQLLTSHEEIDMVVKKVKDWLVTRDIEFPLSKSTIFWDASTMTQEDIHKRMRPKSKNE